MAGRHIFISYSRDDASWALRVDEALRTAGFDVWRDDRKLPDELDYTSALEHAIEAASHVVVCLTPGALGDISYVRREVQFALALADPKYRKSHPDAPPPPTIVPIVFPGGRPLIQIATLIYLSLEDEAGFPALVHDLVERLRRAEVVPMGTSHGDPARVEYLRDLLVWFHTALPARHEQILDLHVRATAGATGGFAPRMNIQFASEPKSGGPAMSVTEAFESAHRRLLLLGAPGSGKTTSLLLLARRLTTAALDDAAQPIPVLGALRLWPQEQSLATWLDELVPTELRAAPHIYLLDGLDELPPRSEVNGRVCDLRAMLLDALPADLHKVPIVITSRDEDFRQLGRRAALRAAVTIAPLDDATIEAYAKRLGVSGSLADPGSALRGLLATPLGLTLLQRTAARRELHDVGDLIDAFVAETTRAAAGVSEALGRFALRQIVTDPLLTYLGITATLPVPDPAHIEIAVAAGILKPARAGGYEFMHAVVLDHFALPALERFALALDDEEHVYRVIGWTHHKLGARATPVMTRLVQQRIKTDHRKDLAILIEDERDARFVPLLLELLTTNTYYTDRCGEVLYAMGTSILPQLYAALVGGEGRVPAVAARVIARHGDTGIERLLAALDVERGDTRIAVLEALQDFTPDVLARVKRLLVDRDPRVRAAALVALRRMAPAEQPDEAFAGLTDPHPDVRASSVQSLTGDDEHTVAALVALIDDDSDVVRSATVSALMKRNRFELLTRFYLEADRYRDASAASRIADEAKMASTAWLVTLMRDARDKRIRENAALALEGRVDATDDLIRTLAEDPGEYVRVGAARSMALIPGRRVDEALTDAIAENNVVSEWAINILRDRGKSTLLQAVRSAFARGMLTDAQGRISYSGMHARSVLKRIDSPAARALLDELPPDPFG